MHAWQAWAWGAVALVCAQGGTETEPLALRIHPEHPHYFQAPDGKPLLLIGDYTWGTFADTDYDFQAMFDTLQANHLNFARVWVWWGLEQFPDPIGRLNMVPYLRLGPGQANDGKPKYDITRPNPPFFSRLRAVCLAAKQRGIYLQLTLFDAWMLKHAHLWKLHAFQRDNNVNGVDGDPANTGKGTDGERGFCSLGNPTALEYQKAFVRQVVTVVNDCDNVLFEIANENYYNADWERHLCEYIHELERDMPRQHLAMPLDLPNHDYGGIKTWDIVKLHRALLKARGLQRPLIFDTDGIGNPEDDVVRRGAWTAFTSGGHVDYLDDSLQPGPEFHGSPQGERYAALRRQLGHLAQFAEHVRFWEMQPRDDLVGGGSAYVLASSSQVVAYLPSGGKTTLELDGLTGELVGRWFDPRTGEFSEEFQLRTGTVELESPSAGDLVLLVEAQG